VRLDSIVLFSFRLCFGNLSFSSVVWRATRSTTRRTSHQNNLTKAEKEEHLFDIL
jgi:hypothetical protein